MNNIYLYPIILLAFSCAESRINNNGNDFDQNDGIIINSYTSEIMKGFLYEGFLNGKQIIPASFVKDITRKANPKLFAEGPWAEGFPSGTAYNNYFWLPGGHEGAYLAFGYQGQYLYIHPKYNVVIGKFSTYPHGDASYFQDTDWRGFYAISKALHKGEKAMKQEFGGQFVP